MTIIEFFSLSYYLHCLYTVRGMKTVLSVYTLLIYTIYLSLRTLHTERTVLMARTVPLATCIIQTIIFFFASLSYGHVF